MTLGLLRSTVKENTSVSTAAERKAQQFRAGKDGGRRIFMAVIQPVLERLLCEPATASAQIIWITASALAVMHRHHLADGMTRERSCHSRNRQQNVLGPAGAVLPPPPSDLYPDRGPAPRRSQLRRDQRRAEAEGLATPAGQPRWHRSHVDRLLHARHARKIVEEARQKAR